MISSFYLASTTRFGDYHWNFKNCEYFKGGLLQSGKKPFQH